MIFKKLILISFYFATILYPCYIRSQECKPPPGPPPDNVDENYSYNLEGNQNFNIPPYIEELPSVGILNTGNVAKMENLLNKFGISYIYVYEDFNPETLLNHVKTVTISTGGLNGLGKSVNLKLLLVCF